MIISHPDETTQTLARPAQVPSANVLDKLTGWEECDVQQLKPPVTEDALAHRRIRAGEFWRDIPAYADVDEETFLDYSWQGRKSITNPKKLREALGDLVSEQFHEEVATGYRLAPMSMRVSPYLLSLMNWDDPIACPLRRQFIPVGQQLVDDHPQLHLDSLHEQEDSPVPGLTHRY